MIGSTIRPRLRVRLVWLLAIVAVVAFNCAALRAAFDRRNQITLFTCVGSLPMANLLAAGLLLGIQYPSIRRFLVGFEIFGTMSVAALVMGILLFFGIISGKPPALLELLVVAWLKPSFDRWPVVGPNSGTLLRMI